jgi:hypothetical protein
MTELVETDQIETEVTLKQKFVDGLRALADFIDESSLPENAGYTQSEFYVFCRDARDFSQTVSSLGSCKKSFENGYLNATKTFGDSRLQVTIDQELVCTKVKVGERIVAARPQSVEEIYEWECPPSFLAIVTGSEAV